MINRKNLKIAVMLILLCCLLFGTENSMHTLKATGYRVLAAQDENSVPLDEKHAAKYINHQIQFQDFKLLDLAEDTDILIICKSGKWVPESIQILYYTWQNYFETIQRIKNIPTIDISD